MALLFIDSFDHYDDAHILAKWTSRSNAGFHLLASGAGRCATNALQVITGGGVTLTKGIPFGGLEGIIGFAFNCTLQTFGESLLLLVHSGIGSGVNLRLYRLIDGSLQIKRADSPDVILATTPADVTRCGEWFYIELRMLIDAAAGAVEIKVNGVQQAIAVGVDTVAALSGAGLTGFSLVASQSFEYLIDDLYALDTTGAAPTNTFLGDVRVEYLRPEAAGTYQQFGLVGPFLTHWEAVDDGAAPDDDTSYVHSATVGEIDTEEYENTGLPAGTIFGVQLDLLARKTDSGFREIRPVVYDGASIYQGSALAPSFASYVYLMHVFALNPATGLAWTIAEVNASEYGVRIAV